LREKGDLRKVLDSSSLKRRKRGGLGLSSNPLLVKKPYDRGGRARVAGSRLKEEKILSGRGEGKLNLSGKRYLGHANGEEAKNSQNHGVQRGKEGGEPNGKT